MEKHLAMAIISAAGTANTLTPVCDKFKDFFGDDSVNRIDAEVTAIVKEGKAFVTIHNKDFVLRNINLEEAEEEAKTLREVFGHFQHFPRFINSVRQGVTESRTHSLFRSLAEKMLD